MKIATFQKKLNNAGTSLVELIVSILILGIIVTPAISSFVTSIRVNERAKEIAQAEAVAANIMEEINFLGFTGIDKAPSLSGYEKVVTEDTPTKQTLFTKTNLISQGDGKYNVNVTFNSDVKRNGAPVNAAEFADISDLKYNTTVLINCDIAGFDSFEYQLIEDAYTQYISDEAHEDTTPQEFLTKIKKEINVDINWNDVLEVYRIDSTVRYSVEGEVIFDSSEDSFGGESLEANQVDDIDAIYILYKPIINPYVSGNEVVLSTDHDAVYINIGSGVQAAKGGTGTLRGYIVVQADVDDEIKGQILINTNNSAIFSELRSQISAVVNGENPESGPLGRNKRVDRIYEVTVEVSDEEGNLLTSLQSSVMH